MHKLITLFLCLKKKNKNTQKSKFLAIKYKNLVINLIKEKVIINGA